MYNKTFRINGIDLAEHVYKSGPQFADIPSFGLQDKTDMEGTTHTDFIDFKRTLTVTFNPTTPEAARTISNLCKSGILFVTTYDPDTDADVTLRMKPAKLTKGSSMTTGGSVTSYKISDLELQEL